MPNSLIGALTGAAIRRLIESDQKLVSGFRALEQQVQPNGFDLTLQSVWVMTTAGTLGAGPERELPHKVRIEPVRGIYCLAQGTYLAQLNEVLRLPATLMALAEPRSTLLRCGVAVHNAVWDAGYHGRSEVLLNVFNPNGFAVEPDARIVQLVFLPLCAETSSYRGVYQGENLPNH